MAETEKISITMGRGELRLARTEAERGGVSLSALVTTAVRELLEARQRREAGRAILATFTPEERATPTEMEDLLTLWSTPRRPHARRKRKSAARTGPRKKA